MRVFNMSTEAENGVRRHSSNAPKLSAVCKTLIKTNETNASRVSDDYEF